MFTPIVLTEFVIYTPTFAIELNSWYYAAVSMWVSIVDYYINYEWMA